MYNCGHNTDFQRILPFNSGQKKSFSVISIHQYAVTCNNVVCIRIRIKSMDVNTVPSFEFDPNRPNMN